MAQAKRYAATLGLPFAYSTNGHGVVELDAHTQQETEVPAVPSPADLFQRWQTTRALTTDQTDALLVPDFYRPDRLPRYYQRIAIDAAVAAVVGGQRRCLLTLATGTGKTAVAFQICWKLWSAGWTASSRAGKPRVLFLADRNKLAEDPMARDFAPFGTARQKLCGAAVRGKEIHFALYQSLADQDGRPGLYRQYPPDYFDLVVIDECHRGSANDEGRWQDILAYYTPAAQLGMTATPLRQDTRTPKLAPATANRMLKWCAQFFAHATRLRLTQENPFVGLSLPVGRSDGRRVYVPSADVQPVLRVAKYPERMLMALCRFAGLRTPSEPLLLRWAEVDLATGRMLVHSPKTACHPGKETRLVPITPELRPFLEEARKAAPADAVWLVGGPKADHWRAVAERDEGWFRVNIGERLTRQVRRAGLKPWPKPYHNLRASLKTDRLDQHPIQVVCGWLGNSPAIALKHYLSIRESDFEKATGINPARNPARTEADGSRPSGTTVPALPPNTTVFPGPSDPVPSSPDKRTLPA